MTTPAIAQALAEELRLRYGLYIDIEFSNSHAIIDVVVLTLRIRTPNGQRYHSSVSIDSRELYFRRGEAREFLINQCHQMVQRWMAQMNFRIARNIGENDAEFILRNLRADPGFDPDLDVSQTRDSYAAWSLPERLVRSIKNLVDELLYCYGLSSLYCEVAEMRRDGSCGINIRRVDTDEVQQRFGDLDAVRVWLEGMEPRPRVGRGDSDLSNLNLRAPARHVRRIEL